MLNWRDNFTEEVLNQSKDYIESIEKVMIHGSSINAHLKKSSHFTVSISLSNGKIGYMYCTCPKNSHCKHQAAVLTYIEDNDLLKKEEDFTKLIKEVDPDTLKEYVTEVFSHNPELKYDFIRKFKKEPRVDSKPYFDRLESIIEKSEGRDYARFGYYDIEVLADRIEDFLIGEVYPLMKINQYEVVFELLDRIAEVLNDEMYVNDGHWFDACQEYLQIAYRLEETYVLSDEQLDKLEENTSFMNGYM